MLALNNLRKVLPLLPLIAVVVAFSSCATKQEPPLISDGTARESSLPWNQQQRWEQTGQLGPMADRMESRR
jgi:hypothetical protein